MIISKTSQQIIKQTARRIRTKTVVKGFKENTWDIIKNTKKGYTPKYTKMRNLDGNLVNDRERAETLANYFEQRQWHKTRQTPPEHNIPSNNLLETNLNIRTDYFDIQELHFSTNSIKHNKSPGQNRVTAELIKALDEDNTSHLLKLLNKCDGDKALFKEMNQAVLAIIYKKGATDKPENYRPIALLNLSYKILAKTIRVRLRNGLDDHLDSLTTLIYLLTLR